MRQQPHGSPDRRPYKKHARKSHHRKPSHTARQTRSDQ